jgi:RHS repeat-associated protein
LTNRARAGGCAVFKYPFLTLKERDIETGLDYFGARYFASTQGRFTSPDPLLSSGVPEDPQSWNRYSYVLNNPLALIDPDGLSSELPCNFGGNGACIWDVPGPEYQQSSTREETWRSISGSFLFGMWESVRKNS